MDLFPAIIIGVSICGLAYFVLEIREAMNFARNKPSKSVSGIESAIGSNATVSKVFRPAASGSLVGRVRFDGEDWRAEYTGAPVEAPLIGQVVQIREIDADSLTVKVDFETPST